MTETNSGLIVIPTYNEAENVEFLVEQVSRHVPDAHILFIDDNSQDGTAELINSLAEKHQGKVFLIQRAGKLGLGTAYLTGFSWAIERSYGKIVQMDADLSHPPEKLSEIFTLLDEYDAVFGSRYVTGGKTENWGIIRKLISRFGSLYANLILGQSVKDFTGGFNGWRSKTLESLQLKTVRSIGYAFQVELKSRALTIGSRWIEMAITFKEREHGQSKMSFHIVFEAMFRVVSIRRNLKSMEKPKTFSNSPHQT